MAISGQVVPHLGGCTAKNTMLLMNCQSQKV
jgi:hypothetical protein